MLVWDILGGKGWDGGEHTSPLVWISLKWYNEYMLQLT